MLPTNKLSNVVTENERLHNDLAKSYGEIEKLRLIFLDPFARRKLKPPCSSNIESLSPSKVVVNKQIADDLGISIKTVEAHRANIMEKLNANTVADLLKIALGSTTAPKN